MGKNAIRYFISCKKLVFIVASAISACAATQPVSAQVPEAIIAAIGIEAIKAAVSDINANDNDIRERFADWYINDARGKYPNYSVVLIHPDHSVSGSYTHNHFEVPISFGRTIGYEVYFVRHGDSFSLTNNGDGGFINWEYSDGFTREGMTIRAN